MVKLSCFFLNVLFLEILISSLVVLGDVSFVITRPNLYIYLLKLSRQPYRLIQTEMLPILEPSYKISVQY